MSSRHARFLWRPWATAEDRAVLLVQMGVIVGASALFTLGYEVQRWIPALTDHDEKRVVIRGWDGMAWIVWPLAAPVILVLIRSLPLARGQTRKNLLRLAAGSFALFVVVTNVRFLLRVLPQLWGDESSAFVFSWPGYFTTTLTVLPVDFLTYSGFFFATFAIDYYFKHRRRQEESLQLQYRTAQLESDLAHAELSALRGQLHPHFLFNSFNAVTTLVRQHRNDAAVEMIAQLSMLLRLAIERTGRQELSLEAELDFIRRYLAIERIRFGDKLQLELEIDPATLNLAVPNLLLQPLVENAIKHGISRLSVPGKLRLATRLNGDRLEIIIENDGPEKPTVALEASPTGGIGLANTRGRLEKIYGADHRFEMTRRDGGGMKVRLELPWRLAPKS